MPFLSLSYMMIVCKNTVINLNLFSNMMFIDEAEFRLVNTIDDLELISMFVVNTMDNLEILYQRKY